MFGGFLHRKNEREFSFYLVLNRDFVHSPERAMIEQEYYVEEMGEATGPYALRTLQQLAIKNRLDMMTMVCPAGKISQPEWVTLEQALQDNGLSATMSSLYPQPVQQKGEQLSRTVYILLALFLGGFGAHNYYAGYSKQGGLQLAGTLFGCAAAVVMPILVVLPACIGLWVLMDIFSTNKDAKGVSFK